MNPDPAFRQLLARYDVKRLDQEPCSIYGLWPDLRIAYINPAYQRFWAENGGRGPVQTWGLGTQLVDAVGGRLRRYYARHLRAVLETGRPWELTYECSSAEMFRQFRMRALPLSNQKGLLVAHSLVVEGPHDPEERTPAPHENEQYVHADGFVHQCSNCRRVKAPNTEPPRWDWVPKYVTDEDVKASHGICRLCIAFYYGSALK